MNPASVQLPTATILPTPQPKPTDVHGGRIVFTCTRAEVNQICLISADGTGLVQLTHGTDNSYYPTFSKNAAEVVFAVNHFDDFNLYRLAIDVVAGPRQARSELKQLTDHIGNTFSPTFSPDGRQVAFLNKVGGAPPAIWVMGSNGDEPHVLFANDQEIVGLAWSPDGNFLAFTMSTGDAFSYEVYSLDIRDLSLPPIRLSTGLEDIGGSVSWSPDQSGLLVFAGPAAAREIYRLDAANHTFQQLTHGGNNASPAYSPDGSYIVFNSLRNGGQADLFIMRADGHSTRQLTTSPEPDWQPQWAP